MKTTINNFNFTTINGDTKKALDLIERYENATAYNLRDVYGHYSQYKETAFERCANMCDEMGGYNLRIVGANSSAFSVMFEIECGYIYITRENDYFIKTGEPVEAEPVEVAGANYFLIKGLDNELFTQGYSSYETEKMMYDVCKLLAFDDCEPADILEIVLNGRKILYAGWRPNMEMDFIDAENGNVIYAREFPEFDH